MLSIKFDFDWPAVSEKKIFEYYVYINVYCLGVGQGTPEFQRFQNLNSSVNLLTSCKFCPLNNNLTIFPIPMHGRHMLLLP